MKLENNAMSHNNIQYDVQTTLIVIKTYVYVVAPHAISYVGSFAFRVP